MKRCTQCGEWKLPTEFYKQRDGRDGLRGDCKACFAKRAKRWYARNREHVIERVSAWQAANPERVKATRKAANVRNRPINRDAHLRRTFGISSDDYATMLAAQGGGCALCGRKPREGRSLHVDHDHEAQVVRGLLCFTCNAGLGQLREDPALLVDAVAYLAGSVPALDPNRDERALLVGLIVDLAANGAPIAPLVDDARHLGVTAATVGSD